MVIQEFWLISVSTKSRKTVFQPQACPMKEFGPTGKQKQKKYAKKDKFTLEGVCDLFPSAMNALPLVRYQDSVTFEFLNPKPESFSLCEPTKVNFGMNLKIVQRKSSLKSQKIPLLTLNTSKRNKAFILLPLSRSDWLFSEKE